jgi:hypothetical protein
MPLFLLNINIVLHKAFREVCLHFSRFCDFLGEDTGKKVMTGKSEEEEGDQGNSDDRHIDTIREGPKGALYILTAEEKPV